MQDLLIIARSQGSLSEKIEASIIQHCESFTKGNGHCDLCRFDADWEVKICKDSGLTINQSKIINGENYIVVNYRANSIVNKIWILCISDFEECSRPTIRASVDSFLHAPERRYQRGRTPDSDFEDALNYDAIRSELLDPLGPGGSRITTVTCRHRRGIS